MESPPRRSCISSQVAARSSRYPRTHETLAAGDTPGRSPMPRHPWISTLLSVLLVIGTIIALHRPHSSQDTLGHAPKPASDDQLARVKSVSELPPEVRDDLVLSWNRQFAPKLETTMQRTSPSTPRISVTPLPPFGVLGRPQSAQAAGAGPIEGQPLDTRRTEPHVSHTATSPSPEVSADSAAKPPTVSSKQANRPCDPDRVEFRGSRA